MNSILTLRRSKGWLPVQLLLMVVLTGWIEPARGEFRRIPVTSVASCSLRLAGAKDIPHACRVYRDANAKLPVWETALGFEFGRITFPQWQQLVTTYAAWHNWRNLADYDRDRNYHLMDFMPPMIQALNRHRFRTQTLPAQRSQAFPAPTKLAANCWGILYEVLRLAQPDHPPAPTLFVTDSPPMLKVLRQQSMPIQRHLQAGDFVLVSHHHGRQQYLDHVALMIDQQLLFEKAGAGDHVPFRLIDRQTFEQIWNPDVYTFEYRRPYPQQQWLPPEQAFGQDGHPFVVFGHAASQRRSKDDLAKAVPDAVTYFAMKQLPALVNVKGRYRLSPEAYHAQMLARDDPNE